MTLWTSRMGEAAAALRAELRQLVAEHVPPDFLGRVHRRPGRPGGGPAVLPPAGRARPAVPGLAARSSAAAAPRCGSRPWSARRCGRITSRAARSTWASTGSGPTIMRHGTPEQQRKHLPPIARGEVIWCQGFSEPDAGSDLASLRTAARRDGDGWRVSGQKIWTSYATMAQWCFLLARTSRGEKKQQGLTIFLVPMSAPGIEVRPIRSMIGPHHLNEVFFDDLEVTEADVLGARRRGLAGRAGGAGLRAGRHRPLRAVRAAAAGRARPPLGDAVGAAARRAAGPVGADAHALPPGPAAGLPGGVAAEPGPGAAR